MGTGFPSASLVLLGLGTLVIWGECSVQNIIFNPDWGFSSYEVIIPRQLGPRWGDPEGAGRMSFLLRIGGKKNVVHLQPKKLLLPRHLPVFTFTNGIRVEDHPYIPRECNFKGSVEGSPDSEAMLSTCLGGLRGMLKIENRLYQMEPIQNSYTFEHVVYSLKDDPITNYSCGLTHKDIDQQMSLLKNLPASRFWQSNYVHQKYLELAVVLDKRRFNFLNSNLTRAISDTIIMTGVMDSIYQVLNCKIRLAAIEVWTDFSKINTAVPKLVQVLGQFGNYRQKVLFYKLKSDWAHLYVHKYYNDAVGWAYVGTICTSLGASVSVLPNHNLVSPSTWSAHELGHGVGMGHDANDCTCRRGKRNCLMAPAAGTGGISNCSYISYVNTVNAKGQCLENVPINLITLTRCGNKVVETGEECDCGTEWQCKQDECCQPNCKLKPGAQCNSGLCCTNCHFSPSGQVCRREENDCDLAEFCNGTTNLCPDDLYKQDGTPCSKGAHCYHKGCYDRILHCKEIFGSGARNAPSKCYEEIHRRTDRFGHCGVRGRIYRKCNTKDVLCGRLQCVNVKAVPEMPDHTTVVFTHIKEFNLRCWGLDYHPSMVTMQLPDEGAVKDGASCGVDLICINKHCLNISVLKYDCNPEKCNKRGVCNNQKDCHCSYGWAPPFCETPGYGGSIGSGPAGKMKIISKPVKVVPIMLIRLILLVVSLVLVILKDMLGRCFKPKAQMVVQMAQGKSPKKKKKGKGKKVQQQPPTPPK